MQLPQAKPMSKSFSLPMPDELGAVEDGVPNPQALLMLR